MRAALVIRNGHPLIAACLSGLGALKCEVMGLAPNCLSKADEGYSIDLLVVTGMRQRQRDLVEAYRGRVPIVALDLPHVRGNQDVRVYRGGDHLWLPEVSGLPSRRERLGVEIAPRRRGRQGKDGYVLVAGQLPDDSAHGMTVTEMHEWGIAAVAEAKRLLPDAEVLWRPHPFVVGANADRYPTLQSIPGATTQPPDQVSVAEAVKAARLVVVYNSTLGFEAMLLGCPVVAWGEAFYTHLARDVSEMASAKAPRTRELEDLLEQVAWTQWGVDEIASGEAFRFVLEQHRMAEAA